MNQWYLDAVGVSSADEAADKVKVALIDSGVSFSNEVEVAESVDFTDDSPTNPLFVDESGHGSAIAGVICANDDGVGVRGVNPNVELYSAKVLNAGNKAKLSNIIKGIYWAIENNVDIINMSFGTSVNSEAMHAAVKQAYNHDILMIAAAGNTEHDSVMYPAAYNEVIAVGSTDETGSLAEITSIGAELELLAPGEKIDANGFMDIPVTVSGTSLACGLVTGVASLLMQKDMSKSSSFVRELLNCSAKTVEYNTGKTAGLVDYDYALSIYDDFAQAFENGNESVDYSNPTAPADYSDETEDLIAEALWDYSAHRNIIKNCEGSITHNNLKIVLDYCTIPDDCFPSSVPEETSSKYKYYEIYKINLKAMHGGGNYVAHMEYLWYLAVYLGQEKDPTTYDEMNTCIINARNKAKAVMSNSTYYKENYSANNKDKTKYNSALSQLILNSGKMIKTDKTIDSNGDKSYNKTTRVLSINEMKYRALGYMLHISGDVFSHQVIVPSNVTVGDERDHKTIDKQHLTVKQSVLEAKIKEGNLRFVELHGDYITTEKIPGTDVKNIANNLYIDCTEFCSNRYKSAIQCAQNVLKCPTGLFRYEQFIYPRYPEEITNVKLYKFQNHVIAAGLSTSKLTTEQWKKCSTHIVKLGG